MIIDNCAILGHNVTNIIIKDFKQFIRKNSYGFSIMIDNSPLKGTDQVI